MNRKQLKQYEFDELTLIAEHAAPVQRMGYITSSKDLYPELVWPSDIAYGRGSVPLAALVLLYERVVLYVPPSPRQQLEKRWGLPLTTVIDLARAGLIQPLIGHPTDYTSQHLDPLLQLRPPSVWARGLGLLHALKMQFTLDQAYEQLPISAMVEISWIRKHWRRHFPSIAEDKLTPIIGRELATNYADLWIFGHQGIAEALPHLANPSKIAQALLLFNEVRTYPLLFGLQGTANYDLERVQANPALVQQVVRYQSKRSLIVPPSELEILTRGIGLDFGALDANAILEFHASERGKHMRQALLAFEREANILDHRGAYQEVEQFYQSAERLQQVLRESTKLLLQPSVRRDIRKTQRRVQWLFRAGGVAVGGLIGSVLGAPGFAMVGAASGLGMFIAEKLIPAEWREKLVTKAVAQQFSPGIAHAWRAGRGSSDTTA